MPPVTCLRRLEANRTIIPPLEGAVKRKGGGFQKCQHAAQNFAPWSDHRWADRGRSGRGRDASGRFGQPAANQARWGRGDAAAWSRPSHRDRSTDRAGPAAATCGGRRSALAAPSAHGSRAPAKPGPGSSCLRRRDPRWRSRERCPQESGVRSQVSGGRRQVSAEDAIHTGGTGKLTIIRLISGASSAGSSVTRSATTAISSPGRRSSAANAVANRPSAIGGAPTSA